MNDTSSARPPDPKIVEVREKIDLLIEVLRETGRLEEVGTIVGPMLVSLVEWQEDRTWGVGRYQQIGDAIAAEYRALIDGGVPPDLASQVVLTHVKERPKMGTVLPIEAAPLLVDGLRQILTGLAGSSPPRPTVVPFARDEDTDEEDEDYDDV